MHDDHCGPVAEKDTGRTRHDPAVESEQARGARVREPVLARLGLVLEVLERPHDPEPDQRTTTAAEKLTDGRRRVAVALAGVEEACVKINQ